MNKPVDRKQWYIGNWTGLGWLETGLKLAGHVVAFYALTQIPPGSNPALNLPVILLLGIITLAYIAAIYDRWLEKEIIAMLFVVVNVAAHAAMTWTLTQASVPLASLGMLFAAFMLAGDLVKIAFLLRTRFTVRNATTRQMVTLVAGLVIAYAIIILLLWVGTFD
jgi:hypothetical protein